MKWSLIPAIPALLGVAVLCVPPIQSYVLKKAIRYAGRKAGLEINAEHIRIAFPFVVSASGLFASAPGADSLFRLQSLAARIRPAPLFRGIVTLEALDLQQLEIHSGSYLYGTYIDGTLGRLSTQAIIYLESGRAEIGSVDISYTHASVFLFPSVAEEEETPPIEWTIELGQLALNRMSLDLQMPADSTAFRSYINKG